jgi:hypothetical protein
MRCEGGECKWSSVMKDRDIIDFDFWCRSPINLSLLPRLSYSGSRTISVEVAVLKAISVAGATAKMTCHKVTAVKTRISADTSLSSVQSSI